jgi:hypothetical protein
VKRDFGYNLVNILKILEEEKIEREEFDDELDPILVTQDDVRRIFDEMICLGLEEKDLVDNKSQFHHNEV